jgi:hypothetical protein
MKSLNSASHYAVLALPGPPGKKNRKLNQRIFAARFL